MKKFYENFVLRSTENGCENSGGGNPNPNAGEGENDETEHAYLITHIYPNGKYDCVDAVYGIEKEGDLSEGGQMFLIRRK